jgi:hypothetical protein
MTPCKERKIDTRIDALMTIESPCMHDDSSEALKKPPGTVPFLRSPRSKTGTVPFSQAVL